MDIVWDVIPSGKGHLPRYYKRLRETVFLQQFPMTVESPCFKRKLSCWEYVNVRANYIDGFLWGK